METIDIPLIWLHDGDDVRLARAVEAGVYAAHLIATQGPDHRLQAVVEAGHSAEERLWWVGLRIARMISSRVAATNQLPRDDLFQESCVAVAQAIRAFDHSRGVRFTTFVHHVVRQSLLDAEKFRVGTSAASRWDRRAARLVELARRRDPRQSLAEAARAAGVSVGAAGRGRTRLVPLDDVATHDPGAESTLERVGLPSLEFLDLLTPRHRMVLRERYFRERITLAELAARLGVSTSTACRWERSAIAEARAVLDAERTTLSRGRRSAAACDASPVPSVERTGLGAPSDP